MKTNEDVVAAARMNALLVDKERLKSLHKSSYISDSDFDDDMAIISNKMNQLAKDLEKKRAGGELSDIATKLHEAELQMQEMGTKTVEGIFNGDDESAKFAAVQLALEWLNTKAPKRTKIMPKAMPTDTDWDEEE